VPTPIQPRSRRGARTPRGQKTRAAILAAARQMCSSRWLDELSLAELARAAGTTRASVLFQFPEGWPDIAAQLLAEELEAASAAAAALAAERMGAEERLRRLLRYGLQRGEELGALLPNLRAFKYFWGDVIDAVVAPQQALVFDQLALAIRAATPGRQSPSDLRNAAEALYTYAIELACAPAFRRLAFEERLAKLDSATTMAIRGLAATPPRVT
jgi:AcrR family transcriptional regulator